MLFRLVVRRLDEALFPPVFRLDEALFRLEEAVFRLREVLFWLRDDDVRLEVLLGVRLLEAVFGPFLPFLAVLRLFE